MGELYPLAVSTLKALLAEKSASSSSASSSSASSFRVGPGVLRAPPAVRRPSGSVGEGVVDGGEDGEEKSTSELLGELLDMVLVGADDADSGLPEVHLQFKADVFGGLHLKLVKRKDGLDAQFIVADAAARRAVVDHVEELVKHLKTRGFTIVSHALVVA